MTTLGPPRHRPTLAKDAAPPRLHRVRLGALVAMLPLASCSPSAGPFVTLLLTNFPPETARVALQVTTDDDSKQQQFSGNDSLNVITVEFPVGTRGPVTFDAETSLESGCVLGSGTATLPISDDKAYDLKLPIAVDPKRKCTAAPVKLTVRKMGSAQGVITSSPVTEPCDETCSQQTIDYRAGDQVKLSVQVSGDDIFAGWSGGCTGSLPDCSFTITADTTVTATINKCQGFCPMPSTGTSADLFAVWGASPSAVYAVGADGTIVKWNGSAWTAMTSGVKTTLRAVTAPRDNTSLVLAGGDNGLLLVWNGSVWGRFATTLPSFQINAIGANKLASSLYIAGSGGNYLLWDGSKWNPPSGYSGSKTLTGISFMPGTDEHFLSGSSGLLVRYNPSGVFTKYPDQNTKSSANFSAVWAGAQAIYMVGDGGTIVKRKSGDGQDGVTQATNTAANMRSISGANDTTLFAVGDGGTALFGSGSSWTKIPASTSQTLYGVYAVDSSTIIAVGAAGTALRYKP